jgi:hypothetical protein
VPASSRQICRPTREPAEIMEGQELHSATGREETRSPAQMNNQGRDTTVAACKNTVVQIRRNRLHRSPHSGPRPSWDLIDPDTAFDWICI